MDVQGQHVSVQSDCMRQTHSGHYHLSYEYGHVSQTCNRHASHMNRTLSDSFISKWPN